MSSVKEKGYMFSYTYNLEEDQLRSLIDNQIKLLDLDNKDYNLIINVVKNKNEENLGYSYLWIDNEELFNALVGLNYDGSDRIEKIEEELNNPDIEFDIGGNWGDLANQEETRITIKKLSPLVNFPQLNLSQEDREKYKIYFEEVEFSLQNAQIILKDNLKNSLYARNLPIWLEENQIKRYFEVFEKDKRQHFKNKIRFKYPIVKIKNSNVNIIFSNLYPNTASFVFNMARKVVFQKMIKGEKNEALVIFNQNKKREQNDRYLK